ncbi:MAG: kinase/pyrophosphorylase [Chloroflexi bacterium]|nr:kinase/pyrophosphorylase [Chloroflexota bacterium]MBU1746763.1 kinase/pyrophosphorylase [Chloroflexota bacterium]
MTAIHVVSDATGATAHQVVQAALAQFDQEIEIQVHPNVTTSDQVQAIIAEVAEYGGFIVHTLVSPELRDFLWSQGRAYGVHSIDLMGPLLTRLTLLLDTQPRAQPGQARQLEENYYRRIEAIEFTVRHDDGRNPADLPRADIVLVGVSRTSKTPVSMYLSYQGWRVANVPIALGVQPPRQLFEVDPRKVVALTVRPERLAVHRAARLKSLGLDPATQEVMYIDVDHIRQELAYSHEIIQQAPAWPIIDVTSKPVEETASEVVSLIKQRSEQ